MPAIEYEKAQRILKMVKNRENGRIEVTRGVYLEAGPDDPFPSINFFDGDALIKDADIVSKGPSVFLKLRTFADKWCIVAEVIS